MADDFDPFADQTQPAEPSQPNLIPPSFEVDQGLNEALDSQEELIAPVIGGLQDYISDALAGQDKVATKAAKKINGAINKQLAGNGNDLDAIATKLANWIDMNQLAQNWTLSQLAVKSGVLVPGQGLAELRWDVEPAASLGPKYGGILVLSVKEMVPLWSELIEVLREIRDRMGLAPASEPGEPQAEAPEDRPEVIVFPSLPAEYNSKETG